VSGQPFPKSAQLARGERRPWRHRASRSDWRALRAAKLDGRVCRVCAAEPCMVARATELHHIVPRSQGGDDVADNLVGLCTSHHALVTVRTPHVLALLAASLTDAEYAYVVGKLGESGMERLFGVGRT